MGVTLVNEALCYEQGCIIDNIPTMLYIIYGCIKHPFNHMKRFSELKGERFVLYSN